MIPAWLLGTTGRALLIVAAVAAWTMYHRHDAARKAAAECRQEQLEATIAELARREAAAREAARLAQEQAARDRQELEELEKKNEQILADLANAGDSCAIDAGTARRLSDIK